MLKIGQDLEKYYTYEAIHYKGGGEILGNLTGGLIGESSAEKAMKRQQEEAERAARRQTEMFNRRMEEERKRREAEHKRALEESRRAREEQARLNKEAEDKRRAEAEYNRQVAQDTGTLTQANINATLKQPNQSMSKVDYSGSVDKRFKDDDEIDKEKEKLKKAFRVR